MNRFESILIKSIKKANNIYLMGHKSLDLDALGACVGLYNIIAFYKKKNKQNTKIIINDTEHESAVELALQEFKENIKIGSSKDIKNIEENDLLIIVDVNKKHLLQDEKLIEQIKNTIIIDHHNIGKGSIKPKTGFIDTKYSSTCEIISEIILDKKIPIPSQCATLLLAGITLDTNGYAINTTEKTFFYSAFLVNKKASTRKVQMLFKQDFDDYKERQKLILNVEKVNEKIAITVAGENKYYRREYLAKAADTLLLFKGIETSYVIGKLNKKEIGISARSLENGKINKVLSNLNGGGSAKEAAAIIEGESLEKVKNELLKYIK